MKKFFFISLCYGLGENTFVFQTTGSTEVVNLKCSRICGKLFRIVYPLIDFIAHLYMIRLYDWLAANIG